MLPADAGRPHEHAQYRNHAMRLHARSLLEAGYVRRTAPVKREAWLTKRVTELSKTLISLGKLKGSQVWAMWVRQAD